MAFTGEEPKLIHAKETSTCSADGSDSEQLHELCRRVVPRCTLNPALWNGHAQTAWTVVNSEAPVIYYKRRTFVAEDHTYAGHFAVDFVSCPPTLLRRFEDNDPQDDPTGIGHTYLPPRTSYFSQSAFDSLRSIDRKPVVIVLHGLSGGSYETYIRYALASLVVTTGEQKGISGGDWEVSFSKLKTRNRLFDTDGDKPGPRHQQQRLCRLTSDFKAFIPCRLYMGCAPNCQVGAKNMA